MKATVSARRIAGRWFDTFVYEDGSVKLAEMPDRRPLWHHLGGGVWRRVLR